MPTHIISRYRDNNLWINFCRVCSAEGLQLNKDCPGEKKVTEQSDDLRKFVSGLPDDR